MTVQRHIRLEDAVDKLIDDWRRTQQPIPSFNQAVNAMLSLYYSGGEVPQEVVHYTLNGITFKGLLIGTVLQTPDVVFKGNIIRFRNTVYEVESVETKYIGEMFDRFICKLKKLEEADSK